MTSPVLRIDHISVAVQTHQKAKAEHFFRSVLGAVSGASSEDPQMKFTWEIFSLGDLSRLEIVCPTGKGSFLDGFLADRPGGVHHITLQTRDIEEAKALLDQHKIPYFGANEYEGVLWKEIFIRPSDAFGVLIQIAEFRPDDWLADDVKLRGDKPWKVGKKDEGVRLDLAHPGGGKMKLDLAREEARQLAEEILDFLKA